MKLSNSIKRTCAAVRNVVLALVFCFLLDGFFASPSYALGAPTITPGNGSFTTTQNVTMSASAGSIYYTLDGSVPTILSLLYTSAISINSPTQINAVAYQSGTYSSVTTAYLDVDPALAPVLQSNLILRLRSTFGVVTGTGSPAPVTQWTDLSGSANNASANAGSAPVLLARNPGIFALNFNGISQALSLPAGFANFTGGCTLFLVVSPATPAAGARFIDLGNGSASDNLYMSQPSASGADMHIFRGATDSSVSSSNAITVGQFQLLEGLYSGTATGTIFTNGAQDAQSTSMQTANNISRSNNFIGRASGGGNFYAGEIAEILLYSTQLSASQRAAVEAYLIQKYQALSVQPSQPVISVPGGTLSAPTQVVISAEPGTATFMTFDGSTPTSSSMPYLGCPIGINYTQTLKAISIKNGVPSSISTAAYTLDSSKWPAPSASDSSAPVINLRLPTQSQ